MEKYEIRVLINIEELLVSADRSENIKEIYEEIKEKLTHPAFPIYKSTEYFCDYDPDAIEPNCVFGSEDPEELIAEAKNWNQKFKTHFVKTMENVEEESKKAGFNTMAEFLMSIMDMEKTQRKRYQRTLGGFIGAVRRLSDYPCLYNENRQFNTLIAVGPEIKTIMTREVLADIMKHPENYAIVPIQYEMLDY